MSDALDKMMAKVNEDPTVEIYSELHFNEAARIEQETKIMELILMQKPDWVVAQAAREWAALRVKRTELLDTLQQLEDL